jgi:hypothetical protein
MTKEKIHAAIALSGGELDIGEVVGRTCDNESCILPLHLCATTRSEAMRRARSRAAKKALQKKSP